MMKMARKIRRLWRGYRTPPPVAPKRQGSADSRIVESRRVNRRFQYHTIAWTFVLLLVLSFLSYRLYMDANEEIEERFNRQQLLLVKQAGERISYFLGTLTASLRYGAFVSDPIKDSVHAGRIRVVTGLHDLFGKEGGRSRVSEVAYYFPQEEAPPATIPEMYLRKLPGCARGKDACVLVVREGAGRVNSLLVAVPVTSKAGGAAARAWREKGGWAGEKRGWLYARISMADLVDAFIRPVESGSRGRAWLVDGAGSIILAPGDSGLGGENLSALAGRLADERLLETARRIKAGEEGFDWHMGLVPNDIKRGRRYLTAFSSFAVGGERWTLALTASSSEFVGLIRRGFRKGLLLAVFGFVAVILAALLILDRERRRIRAEDRIHWSQQVVESNRRLQALFDGITDAIGILDARSRVLMLNRAMTRLFGLKASAAGEEPQAPPLMEVPPPFSEQSLITATFESGEPGFLEKSVSGTDGRLIDIEYFTYPILDAAGATRQVILHLQDVTVRKQRERLSIVGQMSEQVAHSIRNPIGAISLKAELLGDELGEFGGADTAEARSLLESIRAEVDIINQVTDDYLKYVRMPELEKTLVDCNAMIEDLLEAHAKVAERRQIVVEKELEGDIPALLLDETQMRLALENLLRNGFDAMPGGGRLVVRTGMENGHLGIRISDSGEGIGPERRASLFTPFFTTKATGTGLGLVLSRQIITEHRGNIRFESEEGRGATFIVELPLPVAQEASA